MGGDGDKTKELKDPKREKKKEESIRLLLIK